MRQRGLRDIVPGWSANTFCDPLRFFGSWFVMARSPQTSLCFLLRGLMELCLHSWADLTIPLRCAICLRCDFFAVRRSDGTSVRRVLCKCRRIWGHILLGKIPTAQGNVCIARSGGAQRSLDSDCSLLAGKQRDIVVAVVSRKDARAITVEQR